MSETLKETLSEVIALVDCNNMFASTEMAFRPDLLDRPVVVLSSNDGCCIARNYPAKALNIKMAQPYHEVRHLEQSHGLVAFSANFALYTDMSNRIVSILEERFPSVVPYSIDESFIKIPLMANTDLAETGREIRATILQQTGIGTGIGISTTKTLSKLANVAAKLYRNTGGVVDIYTDPARREKLLALMPVRDVWGVGKAISTKLNAMGVITALDLAKFGESAAKSEFSVVLSRTVSELNGEAVLEWETDTVVNQQIIATRSLGYKVTDKETLFSSVAHHVGRGVRKLRDQDAAASTISVTISTNGFSHNDAQYNKTASVKLPTHSDNLPEFTQLARRAFESIWREGYRYAKTGITITNITPKNQLQVDLFSAPAEQDEKKEALMSALESINNKFGLGTAIVASQKQGGNWQPKSEHRSPEYTTKWADIPVVKA